MAPTHILEKPPTKVRACAHCGLDCPPGIPKTNSMAFCCSGCELVYELLHENGLDRFYAMADQPGVRIGDAGRTERFAYLDDPDTRRRLVDFSDGSTTRVTFHLPAMHCVACIWLLENLYRINPAITSGVVDFQRKKLSVRFRDEDLQLSELAALLTSLGYEPALNLETVERKPEDRSARALALKLGLSGFAFGNIMLMSLPAYLGMQAADHPLLHGWFTWLSFALALPVVIYGASDYWRAAWQGLCYRFLSIEFPISLGLAALSFQSFYQVLTLAETTYLDSLTGLVFFLLCGKWFQRKTYDALSFDRDYRAYFPLAVNRLSAAGEHSVSISELEPGDRIRLRNGELNPADGVLQSDTAVFDFSFVTGESEPVEKQKGDYVYAGGRMVGVSAELDTVKKVSRGYLTSLWNQEAFRKKSEGRSLCSATDRISRVFTLTVVGLAILTAAVWLVLDPGQALWSATAVLIVACPCALALAAPFTHGTALRLLARSGLFLKNGEVLERLHKVDRLVFDKTGTLASAREVVVDYAGETLRPDTMAALRGLVRHSTHPYSRGLLLWLEQGDADTVSDFSETPGKGLVAETAAGSVRLGSAAWMQEGRIAVASSENFGGEVFLAVNGRCLGRFRFTHAYREGLPALMSRLVPPFRLSVLSGDRDRERTRLKTLVGQDAELVFEQSPLEKLRYVQARQEEGEQVLMMGDGLNDAGALKQSEVGVAVVEDLAAFTPASDAILQADSLSRFDSYIVFSRTCLNIIFIGFALSFAYNLVGLSFASAGKLSPLICAVIMPVSSATTVLFAVLATRWAGRKLTR